MADFDIDYLLNLKEDEVVYGLKGIKILIYGTNTLGKTPQAMRFPKPFLVMGESGGSALKGYKGQMQSQKDFTKLVESLTNKKYLSQMQEKYQTIVIDTAEDIVDLFADKLCKEYGVKDVSEIQKLQKGNPNGYLVYRREFKKYINLLTGCGYTVVFISHEETVEQEIEVNGQKIKKDFIQPKGSKSDKSSSRFIRDLCDFRFYIKGNGIDKETKKTIMSTAWCVQTDDFYAGSRFDIQPLVNPFTAENIIKAIEDAQKKSAENQNSGLKEFVMDNYGHTKEDYFAMIKPYVLKLNKLYPDLVLEIVERQLGEGVKVTEATDEQLVELEIIYTNLIDLASGRGIEIE